MKSVFLLLLSANMFFGNAIVYAQEMRHADTATRAMDSLRLELNEVVKTPTRGLKKIIDIPSPAVRLNAENYRYDRKIGSDAILSAVPGLFVQSPYGDQDIRISGRGYGTMSNTGARGIIILLDDIPESDPDGQTRLDALDFNSIGRVEIAKGNESSLYANAPGGVANFISDLDFNRPSVVQFNQFGSFGLHQNGFKAALKSANCRLLTSYSYVNYDGYRQHNTGYRNILNMSFETTPTAHTRLSILCYFAGGATRLPGSLTKEEFSLDPWQADPLSVSLDEKRITAKGRVGVRYGATFGEKLNNGIEVTAYGIINFSEHAAIDYRIINRYGFGLIARYVNKSMLGSRHNEFSVGADLLTQPARTEFYRNIHGSKGGEIEQVVSENIGNMGCYITENLEIIREKIFVLLTGRYDHVAYNQTEETLPARTGKKLFNTFSPRLALDYKLTPAMVFYTSFGWSIDTPAPNELESSDLAYLFNQQLGPQVSRNFEIGIKGDLFRSNKNFLRRVVYEATFFNIRINNQILPYELSGNTYYGNGGKTGRLGVELGATLEIIGGFNFGLTYTWSRFRFLEYKAGVMEIDTTGSQVQSGHDFAGNTEPGVPKNNLYLSLAWSHAINKHANLFLKATYQGISGIWVDNANSDKTNGCNLLNGLIGIDLKFGKFNIMASGGVNNIFNESYVGFINANSAEKRFYEPGAPRNYYLSLNLGYSF